MIGIERPNHSLVLSYLDFIEEMRTHGERVWESMVPKAGELPADFVARLLLREINHEPDLVLETVYWATESETVVGRISLRHSLNENLKTFGGNIGYEIRPSCRRRGIAKEILRLLLQTPKAREISHLLLTCDPDNIASNKTILANGGVLSETKFVEKWQRQTNYYWIDLSGF